MDIQVLASGSSGNCYKISDGKTTILLDAGIPFKKIQEGLKFDTKSISGCFITHQHGDHSKAVPELLRRGFKVYSNEDVRSVFHGVQRLSDKLPYRQGSFIITPFTCQHDVECYGYHVQSIETNETLLYFTDTAYIKYRFRNIHYILAEANYSFDVMAENAKKGHVPWFVSERVVQTHMSIDTLLDFLKANDLHSVKEIYLLHLSNANSDAASFKTRVQKETGAVVYVY
ncbi:MBL fold metallo-hydrolase [Megasphaera cerevisiae]|nr:MBL fold metallo-hydrolase [Megasphaera cerevisiae]